MSSLRESIREITIHSRSGGAIRRVAFHAAKAANGRSHFKKGFAARGALPKNPVHAWRFFRRLRSGNRGVCRNAGLFR
jgi:hypothetical protein